MVGFSRRNEVEVQFVPTGDISTGFLTVFLFLFLHFTFGMTEWAEVTELEAPAWQFYSFLFMTLPRRCRHDLLLRPETENKA